MALDAEDISKHYGGVRALNGARLSLRRGEVHALIGENGAGKSTLARILAGATIPDSGAIRIDGQPVQIRHPRDAQRLGIGMIHQELDLFPSLSVADNILLGGGTVGRFCDLPPGRLVETLSIAQRQLVAIARALSMNARFLLMDEPTSSLPEDAVERLFTLILNLRSQGVSIVYVSHKMDEIFRICDRITVLRDGETIDTLEVAATSPAEVVRLMVGREVETVTRVKRSLGAVVL
ncbi:MAG TPA: ATP-binding cassette domain-containing protein, partial [Chthoniobacterales bacterium]|nr:ATP-binding cassette domain-containing protein [Chthoniobacterales bacterium]